MVQKVCNLILHCNIFQKNCNKIQTALAFLQKIRSTKSSADFLSPEPNGQGYRVCNFQIELFVADLNHGPTKMEKEDSGSFNTLAIPEIDKLKEFDENNDLDTIEHDNPGENSCLYLCEICGKDFAGPITLQIHKKVHISGNLEIIDDLKGPEAQEEPENIDKAKEPIQELTGKFPTTEVLDEVFNFNIFPLIKKVNTSTSANDNDVPANFTGATYPNEAKKSNETKGFEKSISPNEEEIVSEDGNIFDLDSSHVCSLCGKKYSLKSLLTVHLRNDHELEGKSPYGCPKCGKLFKFQGAMKNHINRVHWKEI